MLQMLGQQIVIALQALESGSGRCFPALERAARSLVSASAKDVLENAVPRAKRPRTSVKVLHQLRYLLNPFFVASTWGELRLAVPELPEQCTVEVLNGAVRHLRHWVYATLMATYGVDRSFYRTATRPHKQEPCAPLVRAVFGSTEGQMRERRRLERRFHQWRLAPAAAGTG